MTIIDLLRHGEPEGGNRYRGKTDDMLTIKGRRDMDAVWKRLRGKTEMIVTSPLSRCRQPAETWSEEAAVPCLIEPRFREMEYGAWEGLSHEEIEKRFPGMLADWRRDPTGMQIPGAESLNTFSERVRQGWHDLLHGQQGRHVLVISHSGTMRMILADVLNAPPASIRHFDVCYGSWCRVREERGSLTLDFFNLQKSFGMDERRNGVTL